MEHVVFWSSPSGPTFERLPALADAVTLVQRLRNDHDVTDAEVHAMSAVPLNFRTVVLVEPVLGAATVDDQADVAPLGAPVPGVVPDPVGPFKSLAAVGSQTGMAVGSQTGMAVGSQTGMAVGSQTGMAVGSQTGMAVGSQTGMAVGSQTGMAVGSQAGMAVGSRAGAEEAPRLVGLPSVVPEADDAPAEDDYTPMLQALAEAAATDSADTAEVPEQATGYELPGEPPVRSLGLFA